MNLVLGFLLAAATVAGTDETPQKTDNGRPPNGRKVEAAAAANDAASAGGGQAKVVDTFNGLPVYDKAPVDDGHLSWQEIALSVGVLSYSVILFGFFAWMKIRGIVWDLQSFKIMATLLLVTAALFIMTASYTEKQAAPIFGLLGTLAGYILGKTDRPPRRPVRRQRAETEKVGPDHDQPERPAPGRRADAAATPATAVPPVPEPQEAVPQEPATPAGAPDASAERVGHTASVNGKEEQTPPKAKTTGKPAREAKTTSKPAREVKRLRPEDRGAASLAG